MTGIFIVLSYTPEYTRVLICRLLSVKLYGHNVCRIQLKLAHFCLRHTRTYRVRQKVSPMIFLQFSQQSLGTSKQNFYQHIYGGYFLPHPFKRRTYRHKILCATT